MSRKSKRRGNSATKRRSAATIAPEQPKADTNPLERLLNMADGQPNPQDAFEMFQAALGQCQGVAKASGAANQPWDVPAARCYLRALFGVAASLWRLNRIDEAARRFEGVLEADPDDHLFARYWLVACALDAGRLEQLKPLLDRYDEPSAFWRHAQALWAFAVQGDGDESRRLLKEAHRLDARLVDYLLGDGLVRADQPIRFERGRNSTHSTARLLLRVWRSVPGAATWMRSVLRVPLGQADSALAFPRDQLLRPWSVMVMDKASGRVLCSKMIPGEPAAEELWEHAARVMLRDSERPRRIELSDSDGYDFLGPRLAAAEVECVLLDELPELHALCLKLASSYGGPGKCALADGPGVDRDSMESFYYAAARYFRQAPWKHVPGEIPIEIKAPGIPARYAIVLGRTGVTLGLAVLESWRDAADMISGLTSCDNLSGRTVIFEEEAILAPVDVYLVERHAWPIASPEAYPAVMRLRPGREPGSPTADDLRFLSACMNCLPDFVASKAETRTYPPSVDGPQMEMQLSWMPLRSHVSPRLATLAATDSREREPRSTSAGDSAAVQHVNRKGDRYYLHQGRTKTGKPKYFFSKKSAGELCGQLPDGLEIYESPGGQVHCRRIQPKLITDQEIEVVRQAIQNCGKQFFTAVDVKGKNVIVYEREHPSLKFALCDEDKRLFTASRWCYLGSIDDWLPLCGARKPLSELANVYCPLIGEESFFELM